MPVLFIHGVAVREQGESGWEDVRRATQGIEWPAVQAALRRHLAPVLNPGAPERVQVDRVYWGDLGAQYARGGLFRAARAEAAPDPAPASLNDEDLGEALEARLRATHALRDWPDVITAAWQAARDRPLRAMVADLPPPEQWGVLEAAVNARLGRPPAPRRVRPHRTFRRLDPPAAPHLPAGLQLSQRRNVQRAMLELRRPLEAFVPLFVGDVLAYLNTRGTPDAPGPVPRRVLGALRAAHAARTHPHEPLVVLTHSMGGQLMHDALSAFLPADPALQDLRVDFWCAAGSQVGLFHELGVTLGGAPDTLASARLGYFWNVWAYSDLLSFRAQGVVPGAHDTAFPLPGLVRSDHVAYLTDADFYRTLAAKVQVHAGPGPSGAVGPLESGP
ncbi:hypothetical protein [Deinococcus depolymerans]|uniref:Alpha/beta hydrolase n=1 Tax=Deinococcus depolymerans TaxID=392408 RepID=A0ABN1CND5_9DEIO